MSTDWFDTLFDFNESKVKTSEIKKVEKAQDVQNKSKEDLLDFMSLFSPKSTVNQTHKPKESSQAILDVYHLDEIEYNNSLDGFLNAPNALKLRFFII